VFTIDANNSWAEQALLTASDATAGARFGHSVALSRWTGAYALGPPWPTSGPTLDPTADAFLTVGTKVTVDVLNVVVGAPLHPTGGAVDAGQAYVFHCDSTGTGYVEDAVLTPSTGAVAGDEFGSSVDVDANHVVVGAPGLDFDIFVDAGGAFLYTADVPTTWSETDLLRASESQDGAEAGGAVGISGPHALMGAQHHNNAPGSGYVWAYFGW